MNSGKTMTGHGRPGGGGGKREGRGWVVASGSGG